MIYRITFFVIFILLIGGGLLMLLSPEEQKNSVEFEIEGSITNIEIQHVSVDDFEINAVIFIDGKPINSTLSMPNGISIIDETKIYKINELGIREIIKLSDLKIGDVVHCWVAMKTDHVIAASEINLK